jgi:hypothetical protein
MEEKQCKNGKQSDLSRKEKEALDEYLDEAISLFIAATGEPLNIGTKECKEKGERESMYGGSRKTEKETLIVNKEGEIEGGGEKEKEGEREKEKEGEREKEKEGGEGERANICRDSRKIEKEGETQRGERKESEKKEIAKRVKQVCVEEEVVNKVEGKGKKQEGGDKKGSKRRKKEYPYPLLFENDSSVFKRAKMPFKELEKQLDCISERLPPEVTGENNNFSHNSLYPLLSESDGQLPNIVIDPIFAYPSLLPKGEKYILASDGGKSIQITHRQNLPIYYSSESANEETLVYGVGPRPLVFPDVTGNPQYVCVTKRLKRTIYHRYGRKISERYKVSQIYYQASVLESISPLLLFLSNRNTRKSKKSNHQKKITLLDFALTLKGFFSQMPQYKKKPIYPPLFKKVDYNTFLLPLKKKRLIAKSANLQVNGKMKQYYIRKAYVRSPLSRYTLTLNRRNRRKQPKTQIRKITTYIHYNIAFP